MCARPNDVMLPIADHDRPRAVDVRQQGKRVLYDLLLRDASAVEVAAGDSQEMLG